MANTIIGLAGLQYAIESPIAGINIKSFSVTYKPEFKSFIQGFDGTNRGFCVPDSVARECSIEGEVLSGGTGIMGIGFTSAVSTSLLANDLTTFGGAGGWYADQMDENQDRNGFRSVSVKLSSFANIA